MEDEWNWGYLETTKDLKLKEFEDKWDGYIERITEWPHFVVYNIEKSFPYSKERLKLIRDYCDHAYATNDHSSGIDPIQLPKSEAQEALEDMEKRRTQELKKASEDLVSQKMKDKGWI